jgi:ABC-type Fe3+ transport system permease subunit
VTTVNKIWHTWLISLFITLLACLIGMAAVCVAARQDEDLPARRHWPMPPTGAMR